MKSRETILREMGTPRLTNPTTSLPLNDFSSRFGKYVFSRSIMQKMLPKKVYKNVLQAINGIEKLHSDDAGIVATAVKEWAMSHGATHFCHWFQPLTGGSAEKHDAFIEWNSQEDVIENFSGKQLLQGEPDASSFPSGGLRNTYEARGCTGWDPTSSIFLWKAGGTITLCIPSVFFSWTGDVLDSKIPLLRSEAKIKQAALRLLQFTGLKVSDVYTTLGIEQEYFVIDRSLRNLRPDLILAGKTVLGASPPKGQELQDHYFGSVKGRILAFMHAFEIAAIELGIPVKTRHNEVAPSQHEVAPVFEKASAAIDHNLLLMELMRQIAQEQGLACLLHEKPFAGMNGSGKHCNWALATDTGINLLDPTETPKNQLHFLVLLAAFLQGVHRHSALLRAAIGSSSNDYRLGGHEAPPAIISVFLGTELETLLQEIETEGMITTPSNRTFYDLKLRTIPEFTKETTDRNRTSPIAFTGNKFEFRAVGSSANPSFATTVLNLVVAESLNELLDEMTQSDNKEELSVEIMKVLQKSFKRSKPIRYTGNNYSPEWFKEAQSRGLPILKESPKAFEILSDVSTIRLFEHVLTAEELTSLQLIAWEHYALHRNIEANLIVDLFRSKILPVAIDYQTMLASSFLKVKEALALPQLQLSQQALFLTKYNEVIELAMNAIDRLEKERLAAHALPWKEQAHAFATKVMHSMTQAREAVDHLETLTDQREWPLPQYWELLFMI